MGNGASAFATPPRVVVIGGGYAGIVVVPALEAGGCDVTLIDRSPSFHHLLGATRACAEPGFEAGLLIPRDRLLRKPQVVGTVTSVDAAANTVHYTAGTGPDGAPSVLPYDYLVVATGMEWSSPGCGVTGGPAAVRASYRAMRAAVAASSDIVVVGGGSVGAEIAGEIACGLRDAGTPAGARAGGKRITVVHSGPHLVSGDTTGSIGKEAAVGNAVATRLEGVGVTLLLNERLAPLPADEAGAWTRVVPAVQRRQAGAVALSTVSGKEVTADLLIWAVGGSPSTGFLKASPGFDDALTPRGELVVDAHFRVAGQPNVFAVGDVAASGHPKMALVIQRSTAAVVARNVLALARARAAGAPDSAAAFATAPPGPMPFIIILGKHLGFGRLGPGWLPDMLVHAIKGHDKLAGRTAGELKYSVADVRAQAEVEDKAAAAAAAQ